jgi:hypothetical protein
MEVTWARSKAERAPSCAGSVRDGRSTDSGTHAVGAGPTYVRSVPARCWGSGWFPGDRASVRGRRARAVTPSGSQRRLEETLVLPLVGAIRLAGAWLFTLGKFSKHLGSDVVAVVCPCGTGIRFDLMNDLFRCHPVV